MKKKLVTVLVMVMATFAFSACSEVDEVVSAISEAADEAESELANEVAGNAAADEEEYYYGELTETSYKSGYLGLQYDVPADATLADQATIAQLSGLASDVIADNLNEKMAELAKNSVVYELYAGYEDGTNIVVASESNKYKLDDLNQLADANEQQFAQMANMNVTVSPERETVEIGGISFLKMSVVNEYQGVSLNQDMYMAFIKGVILSINVTYMDGNEAEAQALIEGFSAY